MELIWDDNLKYGYYPVDTDDWPYDEKYFEKYLEYEDTSIGIEINKFRTSIIDFSSKSVCDVGIGSGTFIKNFKNKNIKGFDVNPAGISWLKENKLWGNPYEEKFDVLTFWDSFEHIPNHCRILKHASTIIISLPIFNNRQHALSSKHFRPNEHYWYFTFAGLVWYLKKFGFQYEKHCANESYLGREDIVTFVFNK